MKGGDKMNIQAQKKHETRGRKRNPNGKIISNGLFQHQWKKIRSDAISQGIDSAALLRRIVDWYYDAKEQQEIGSYPEEEFKKLEKAEKEK